MSGGTDFAGAFIAGLPTLPVRRGQLQQVVDRYVSPGLDAPVKLEFIGEVMVDPAVRDAVKRRQLLLECYPGSLAAQGVVAAATRLLD
jgi:flagellar biosynthesis protein FlhG